VSRKINSGIGGGEGRPRTDRETRFRHGIAAVRIARDGQTFALSIGDLSVDIDRRGAQEVVAALTYALLVTLPATPAARPQRKRRRPPRPAKPATR
jgi:hypothetical protein